MRLDKILAILVLYNCTLEDSETFNSLNVALKKLNKKLDLLVYDNSPIRNLTESDLIIESINIIYIHDKTNPGISKAYNEGLQIAQQLDKSWILLLDQDTILNFSFLSSLGHRLKNDSSYVSIVPLVYENNKIISPSRFGFLGSMHPIKKSESNSLSTGLTAINSGSCISVNFLSEIGGFNSEFPLDMLDHWLYYIISKQSRLIYVSGTSIQHNLSVNDLDSLSKIRYSNILQAENKFYRLRYKNRFRYRIKLILRIFKLLVKSRYSFVKLCLKHLI